MSTEATPREVGSHAGLGPLPLWRDDAGRSWWGADELTGAHLLAWRDAAVAAERERLLRDVAGLHMAQSVNNQNHPNAWHDGVDAALDAIRGA